MKKILALALFAVALVSCRQTMQTDGFKLSGHLEGLQVGDTLFRVSGFSWLVSFLLSV